MQGFVNHKVDEIEYQFGMLDPFKASKLISKITRSILRPLGAFFTGKKKTAIESTLDAEVNFESAFGALADNVTEEDFDGIVRDLLSTVKLDTGMDFNPNLHFIGRVWHMYRVAYKSFEVNFADFLDAKSGVVPFLRRALSRVQAPSTGSSGASSSPESPVSQRLRAAGR